MNYTKVGKVGQGKIQNDDVTDRFYPVNFTLVLAER